MTDHFDIAVIGGGIVGCATALTLCARNRGRVVVLEAESLLAAHQTGNNSGVIHSGLYYRPGSARAALCAQGRDRMYDFCEAHAIPHRRCGKIVVAVCDSERPALAELKRRGEANGLAAMKDLDGADIRHLEPAIRGVAGLRIAETGVVDYRRVVDVMARLILEKGGAIRTGHRVTAVQKDGDGFRLVTSEGTPTAAFVVNCAGLQCDRVARLCGVPPDLRIVPFRGEYYEFREDCRHLVNGLVYPVPDPALPFLGVHFTRMVDGRVEAGPNAVLALRREGYDRTAFSLRDTGATITWPGFWKLAARHWRSGAGEIHRSFSKTAFVTALRHLMPDLDGDALVRGGAGVRAQALSKDGRLLDDFEIRTAKGQVHVLNAPSPAATASLAIGQVIADRIP
jgi:L-2-hydroxyglutarate oxidase